jgi:nitrogen fixation NifU-like protein
LTAVPIEELYHKEILRLASEAHGAGRLPRVDATASTDNPLCGDRITIDVELEDERIKAIGFDAKACLLCQASASLLGRQAIGKTHADIESARAALADFLRAGHEDADGGQFAVFAPVRAYKIRHRCLLLPFEALLAALAAVRLNAITRRLPVNGPSP